ncbi:TetR/AcrR family transcriptional regulator [Sinirhodobacter sp. WL0062]|uniref:TetR/AcrR family transcriptional regulator n=1 Tax=Rhodobacter flavimaris TaxID=2907145 RepID=A0ABS8YS21_9RHOB|nr:TetR/AcrR family transcriptional regulator [Sinirhodobacter sp. WL0062]MCE5972493.1 TetR/AcrR family transcriptional regulator [Sinirhodobacter sp. WL0062]
MGAILGKESNGRGSRDGWLQAAYAAFVEGGLDAVRIQPMAERLKLSRTSFYWHFRDREDVVLALTELWEAHTTVPLIAAARAYAASEAEAMLNVIGCFLRDATFDVRFELAIRSGALQDALIMERLLSADRRRLAALSELLQHWGHEPQDADVRARTIYLVQIGYISMQVKEDIETRLLRVPNYVQIYTGGTPTLAEIERFHGQHDLNRGGAA